MWEEHPLYQKAQVKMIGPLVAMLFIGLATYCVSKRDWDALRIVLCAGGGLVVALAFLRVIACLVVKVLAWPSKSRSGDDA